MLSKQYEVPYLILVTYEVTYPSLQNCFGNWSFHWRLDGKQLLSNVLQQSKSYAKSICVMYLVERNVSSTHTKEEQSPCERLAKPKMQHESEFTSIFIMLKNV